jgi:hypothetical protein
METFDDLQNLWNKQSESKGRKNILPSDIIKKAEEQTRKLKKTHIATILVLSLTIGVLVWYFVWVSAHKTGMTLGLALMIGSLVVRVLIEWISTRKLNKVKLHQTVDAFSRQIDMFYIWRKQVHIIFTPIIYLTYVVGFIILLPLFKKYLSSGFYLYILISGIVFLSVFGFFLFRFLRKELQMLNSMRLELKSK